MNFIMNLLNEGGPRLHAFVTWLTAVTLSIACIIITIAIVCTSKNLSVEFGTAIAALTGLAGYSYNKGKQAERE